MVRDFRTYPEYKGSGMPWLGQVPAHWEIYRLKTRVANVIITTNARAQDEIYVALEHVESWTGRLHIAGKDIQFESQVKRFSAGDVLFGKLRPYLAKVTRPAISGVCVGEFFVLRPIGNDLEGAFLEYLLRSKLFIDVINSSTFGAKMPRADWSFVGNLDICYPPIHEQRAIVRFLDHADRRIKRYIRAKQKLIKLLDEQKQAIIHQAVTRGLDPNVRLKPSGVEWLRDIPEHWKVVRIRNIAQVVRGGTPRPAGSPVFFHGNAEPWITVGELTKDNDMYLRSTTTRLTPAGVQRSRIILTGTLLLTNSGATLGVPKITRIEGCINDGVAAFLHLHPRIVKEYLYFYLLLQTSYLRSWVNLGAQPNLNTQIIGDWPVVVPPPSEQQTISEWISNQTIHSNRIVERVRREINLLQEYRTRLIADVVTGKLDVREAAAQLPDEPGEVEPLDALADEAGNPDSAETETEAVESENLEVEA